MKWTEGRLHSSSSRPLFDTGHASSMNGLRRRLLPGRTSYSSSIPSSSSSPFTPSSSSWEHCVWRRSSRALSTRCLLLFSQMFGGRKVLLLLLDVKGAGRALDAEPLDAAPEVDEEDAASVGVLWTPEPRLQEDAPVLSLDPGPSQSEPHVSPPLPSPSSQRCLPPAQRLVCWWLCCGDRTRARGSRRRGGSACHQRN